jgi:Bacterial protein of unknown function (DUF937)
MNLVEYIKDQLPTGLSDPLGSLIGAGDGVTRSAINAAVPALLSALSSAVSTGSGAQKLASALGHFGGVSMDNLAEKVANQPGSLLEQGAGLVSSLFGSGAVSAIVSALSRFTNIAPGQAQKLLGYLTPMILGAIAGQFGGKPVTTQALSSLFADQKANIANALPRGFSLDDVSAPAGTGSAVRTAAREVESTAPSVMRWLLPLLVLGALGLLLWSLLPRATTPEPTVPAPGAPAVPAQATVKVPVPETPKVTLLDTTHLSTELTDTFKALTETLTGVKDAPSAEAALPKLQDFAPRLDAAKAKLDNLTDAGKATVTDLITSSQAKLKELVDKVLAIPGVGEKLRAVVDTIMAKISDLAR